MNSIKITDGTGAVHVLNENSPYYSVVAVLTYEVARAENRGSEQWDLGYSKGFADGAQAAACGICSPGRPS